MPHVNVYRNIDNASEFVGSITLEERDARIVTMNNADPAGMPSTYAYRDADGVVWGFAESLTADEAAALSPQRHVALEQAAADDAAIDALLWYPRDTMQHHLATIKPITFVSGGCLDQFEATVSFCNASGIYAGERVYFGRLGGNEPDAIKFSGIGCDGATDAELAAICAALQSINQRGE